MTDPQALFAFWLTNLHDSGGLVKAAPAIQFKVVSNGASDFTAQVIPGDKPRIELNQLFIDALHVLTASSIGELFSACAAGFEHDDANDELRVLIEASVLELQLSFVILHEIFHILCGHLGLHSAKIPFSGALNEKTLGMASSDADTYVGFVSSEMQRAYFQEFEADNCAALAIIQLAIPPQTAELLSLYEGYGAGATDSSTFIELDAIREIVAYRLLLIAGWQTIRLLESLRGAAIRQRARYHPFPGARLLAHMHTLIEGFCGEVLPKSSHRTLKIDEELQSRISLYFDQVARPCLKCGWDAQNSQSALDGFESRPETIVRDTINLLIGGKELGPLGREILALDEIREKMHFELAPYRYYLTPEDRTVKKVTRFDVMVGSEDDVEFIESKIRETFANRPEVTIETVDRKRSYGMSGGDIAIFFAVSLLAGITILGFQKEIETSIAAIRGSLKRDIRVEFNDDEDEDDSEIESPVA